MVGQAWVPIPAPIPPILDRAFAVDGFAVAYAVLERPGMPLRVRMVYPNGCWHELVGNPYIPEYRTLTDELVRHSNLAPLMIRNRGEWELLVIPESRAGFLVESAPFWAGETLLLRTSGPLRPLTAKPASNRTAGSNPTSASLDGSTPVAPSVDLAPPAGDALPTVRLDPIGVSLVKTTNVGRLRHNPFRVLQLPATASDRQIAKRRQVLEMALKGGLPLPDGPEQGSPSVEPTTLSRVSEAADVLRSIEERLSFHLFWYWRSAGAPKSTLVVKHDQLVAQLYRTLDEGDPAAAVSALQSGSYLALWVELLQMREFRPYLEEFLASLADARLSTSTADSLARALPVAAARVMLDVGLEAASRSSSALRDLYERAVQQLGTPVVQVAMQYACEPLRMRVQTTLQRLQREDGGPVRQNWGRLVTLVQEVKPIVAQAGPTGIRDPLMTETGDYLALVVAQQAGKVRNKSGAVRETLETLRELRQFVVRPSTLSLISDEIEEHEYVLFLEPLEAQIERALESTAEPRAAFESMSERLLPRLRDALREVETAELRESLEGAAVHLARTSANRLTEVKEFALAREALRWARMLCTDSEVEAVLTEELQFLDRMPVAETFARIFLQIKESDEIPSLRLRAVEHLLLPRLDELLQMVGGDDEVTQGFRSGAALLLRDIALEFNNQHQDPTNALRAMVLALKYAPDRELSQRLVTEMALLQQNRAAAAHRGEVSNSGCFIATAAYGTPLANEVALLRTYRDRVLARSKAGRSFIAFYYRYSPNVASWIAAAGYRRWLVRSVLRPVLQLCQLGLRLEGGANE